MFRRVEVARHFLRRPWIPDDGGVGIEFLHANRPLEVFVADFHRAGRVGINAVGFLCDPEWRGVTLAPHAVGAKGEIVERYALQAGDGNRADIADVKISVQAVFDLQTFICRFVGGDEFHRQPVGDGDGEFRAQRRPFGLHGISGQPQTNLHRAVLSNGTPDPIPRQKADATVRGFSSPRAEPGETDRHPAANRFAGSEMAEPAQEKQGRFAGFLEGGDVRAVQIDFRCAPGGRDVDFEQAAVAADDGNAPGDFKFPQLV